MVAVGRWVGVGLWWEEVVQKLILLISLRPSWQIVYGYCLRILLRTQPCILKIVYTPITEMVGVFTPESCKKSVFSTLEVVMKNW